MISIVVPVFNEEESIQEFYNVLVSSLSKLRKPFEVIFIDDGSTDSSLDRIKKIVKSSKNISVYSFRTNQGKAEALTLGFEKAKGDIIVTLDADLQDRPEEIARLLPFTEDYDLVCGWRKYRNDPPTKVLSSKIFNQLANILWGLKLHDYNCGLKVYTKDVAKSLKLYGGMHRFIPLLAYQQGFSVTEVPVEHELRKFGKSKYGYSKILKDLPDIFTMIFLSKYRERPLHFFGAIGGISFMIGFLISFYLSILHFQGEAIGRRPLLFLGVLLMVVGVQIFFTGFLADLILSISKNAKGQSLNQLVKYSSEKE